MEIELSASLTAMPIIARTKDAVYVRLPKKLQRVIESGCDCNECRKDPNLAKWDTLVVPLSVIYPSTYVVHMPEASVPKFVEYHRKLDLARQKVNHPKLEPITDLETEESDAESQ